jgi:hypothetical protein
MKLKLISAAAGAAGLFALGCFVGQATADQPHMQSALSYLRGARGELIKAEPNKGGHRERAIRLIDQAIAETQDGIAFARHH